MTEDDGFVTVTPVCYMYGDHECDHYAFRVGDKVRKMGGWEWSGVVVSCFETLDGKPRYVIECTMPQISGALHVGDGMQFQRRED